MREASPLFCSGVSHTANKIVEQIKTAKQKNTQQCENLNSFFLLSISFQIILCFKRKLYGNLFKELNGKAFHFNETKLPEMRYSHRLSQCFCNVTKSSTLQWDLVSLTCS